MDSQNPAVQLTIHGREVPTCIIDGGSGVNVISEATRRFGQQLVGSMSLLVRMANTRSVRPIGLICNLEFILGGLIPLCPNRLPTPAWMTVAANNQHQAALVAQQDFILVS